MVSSNTNKKYQYKDKEPYGKEIDTRTYEDFYKYLGVKPTNLGIVSRMYDDLTATFLTESLKNIFYQDAKGSGNKYQSVNALQFDWQIETNQCGSLIVIQF